MFSLDDCVNLTHNLLVHKIHRQRAFLLANPGVSVPQEMRGFDENTFETYPLRSKEGWAFNDVTSVPSSGIYFQVLFSPCVFLGSLSDLYERF
jgi:hypothetical protein